MTGDTGKIRYPKWAKQQIDFSGVRFGNATPSNVDGLLELKDHFFVILEYKHKTAAKMSTGQRLMIERVCDAIHSRTRPPSYCVAIVAQHNEEPPEDIDGAHAKVLAVRWEKKWINVSNQETTVIEQLNKYHHIAFTEPF